MGLKQVLEQVLEQVQHRHKLLPIQQLA